MICKTCGQTVSGKCANCDKACKGVYCSGACKQAFHRGKKGKLKINKPMAKLMAEEVRKDLENLKSVLPEVKIINLDYLPKLKKERKPYCNLKGFKPVTQ